MKVLKLTILYIILFFVLCSMSNPRHTDPTKNTSNEIRSLLTASLKMIDTSTEVIIYIGFILNNENDIIVLSTNSKALDGYIKSTLNYKNIESNDLVKGKKYTIPVLFKR